MKKIFRVGVVAVVLLAACDKPVPIESVESLVANPGRTKELRAQCKVDPAKVGEAQCNAAAEAWRQRFMRAAPSPYESGQAPSSSPSSSVPGEREGSK